MDLGNRSTGASVAVTNRHGYDRRVPVVTKATFAVATVFFFIIILAGRLEQAEHYRCGESDSAVQSTFRLRATATLLGSE